MKGQTGNKDFTDTKKKNLRVKQKISHINMNKNTKQNVQDKDTQRS